MQINPNLDEIIDGWSTKIATLPPDERIYIFRNVSYLARKQLLRDLQLKRKRLKATSLPNLPTLIDDLRNSISQDEDFAARFTKQLNEIWADLPKENTAQALISVAHAIKPDTARSLMTGYNHIQDILKPEDR